MSTAASHLPPIAANGVFSVSASSLIDAPIQKVWETLMDFKSYKEWNAFVREQTVCDVSKHPHDEQIASEGRHLLMNVHLPPTMEEPSMFRKSSAFVIITTVDNENYRAAWKTAGMPYFLLHTERWQALSVDEATGKTKYETIEVFGGVLAYFIKYFIRSNLSLGFKAMADGLKSRAEQN